MRRLCLQNYWNSRFAKSNEPSADKIGIIIMKNRYTLIEQSAVTKYFNRTRRHVCKLGIPCAKLVSSKQNIDRFKKNCWKEK